VAHAFLGSMYFLFDQKDAACGRRRSYELVRQRSVRPRSGYGRKERKQAQPAQKR